MGFNIVLYNIFNVEPKILTIEPVIWAVSKKGIFKVYWTAKMQWESFDKVKSYASLTSEANFVREINLNGLKHEARTEILVLTV